MIANWLSKTKSYPARFKILLAGLFISLVFGLLCGLIYDLSPRFAIHKNHLTKIINKQEDVAESTAEELKNIIIHSSVDSLSSYPFEDNDTYYFVFNKNKLVFWSDNSMEINPSLLNPQSLWQPVQLPNAFVLIWTTRFDNYRILSVIKIKNSYPYENEELVNSFTKGFNCDKQIQIVNGNPTDQFALTDQNQTYLFSLAEPKKPVYNEAWAIAGFIGYSVFFILFFILYCSIPLISGNLTIDNKQFKRITFGVAAIIGLLLYFGFPQVFFFNTLFTPFQYASNPFLNSFSHLSVLTGYFISTVYLYFFHTKTRFSGTFIRQTGRQLVSIIYFISVYYILRGLIFHSSIQLSILHFHDFSLISLWVHFLLLIWGIGLVLLFFKTHFPNRRNLFQSIGIDLVCGVLLYIFSFILSREDALRLTISYLILWSVFYIYFLLKNKNIFTFMALWLLVFSGFITFNSLVINSKKKMDKYRVLAQNSYINGSSENDQMADFLLEELDLKIARDKKIAKVLTRKDSVQATNDYLNKTYLRGFWNKYDMRLNVLSSHSTVYKEYMNFIANSGSRIKKTHFYNVPSNENNLTYIGYFQATEKEKDSLYFFMEFYPRRNFKSYSFPNLLITATANIQSQLNISIAKYERNRLVYASGKVEFPNEAGWIPQKKSEFFQTVYKNRMNFIYKPNSTSYLIIAEQEIHSHSSYLLYFAYVFLAFFAVSTLIIWIYQLRHRKWKYKVGLTTKFQVAFIVLLIISFIGIFFVSVNFIEDKYREQQIANLESKKSYIQKALQDLYYWNQDLNNQNSQVLNFDLQDLSYIYHTDIHVYDNHGELVGSSQPIIFNKKLISIRISPTPFLNANSNLNQYEHIGKLTYLSGYTDFVNGDYLQLGFISIPQFFSQDEIKAEIESFLAVIIHIYLIIIILAILLSLFIGKQLAAPLNVLETKLKEMRLGRRNEKIDYTLNDEIGQLVIQYNRTVDELEHSAGLLAQSERESAWKSMARQVAHEINNPLTPMKLTIQQLQRTKDMDDKNFDIYFKKSTAMLIEQIDNLSRIAGTFSNFARMPEANFVRLDIAARLYSVAQLFANNNEHVKLDYLGVEHSVFVYADPEQMVQVFNNLLKNAIQSIPENRVGVIKVSIKHTENQIIIEFSDNGIGIDNALRDKLFTPNFTTKSTGMGLGLAITKNIIELTGGSISFRTEPDKGTTFTVILPESI
ncbi:MAG: ATP-binding protein [Paludibacter sp.]